MAIPKSSGGFPKTAQLAAAQVAKAAKPAAVVYPDVITGRTRTGPIEYTNDLGLSGDLATYYNAVRQMVDPRSYVTAGSGDSMNMATVAPNYETIAAGLRAHGIDPTGMSNEQMAQAAARFLSDVGWWTSPEAARMAAEGVARGNIDQNAALNALAPLVFAGGVGALSMLGGAGAGATGAGVEAATLPSAATPTTSLTPNLFNNVPSLDTLVSNAAAGTAAPTATLNQMVGQASGALNATGATTGTLIPGINAVYDAAVGSYVPAVSNAAGDLVAATTLSATPTMLPSIPSAPSAPSPSAPAAPTPSAPTTPTPAAPVVPTVPSGTTPTTIADLLADPSKAIGSLTAAQLGNLISGAVGAYASNQQTNKLDEMAQRYEGYGAPYRQRLADLYANPSSFLTSKEVSVPVEQGTQALMRSLSTKGNPFGSGNALQQGQSYASDQLFSRLGQEKDRLAGFGGLSSYSAAAPQANTNAIQSSSNAWNAMGSAANNIFNPPQTQAQTMAEWMKIMGGR